VVLASGAGKACGACGAGTTLDGAGWACLAMPRWRGGSGAGAGRNLSSADAVMWRVMELSGSSLIDEGLL
jgi:hypothetical protein